MNEKLPLPGPITLLGSGETALVGGRIAESLARRFPKPLKVAILETPAGFELNSAQIAGRIADFYRVRLQNYDPIVNIIPARKRGTTFSPDNADILKPLVNANLIFMGPGSPTYAVRELKGSLAWDLIRYLHRKGAALIISSAGTIAISQHIIPVYEIYKAGEEIFATQGLDLFTDYGLNLSFIPHWNNTEGGAELDTSRCFIGIERFLKWHELIPQEHTCIGLDEHTGLVINFDHRECRVEGVGSVSILWGGKRSEFSPGAGIPFDALGEYHTPAIPDNQIVDNAWKTVMEHKSVTDDDGNIPTEVIRLVDERQRAREQKEWIRADEIRQRIEEIGWRIIDTPEGTNLVRKSGNKS